VSEQLDSEVVDWVKWWETHRDTDRGLDMQVDFMEKAIEGLFHIVVKLTIDLREVEGSRAKGVSDLIVLPNVRRK